MRPPRWHFRDTNKIQKECNPQERKKQRKKWSLLNLNFVWILGPSPDGARTWKWRTLSRRRAVRDLSGGLYIYVVDFLGIYRVFITFPWDSMEFHENHEKSWIYVKSMASMKSSEIYDLKIIEITDLFFCGAQVGITTFRRSAAFTAPNGLMSSSLEAYCTTSCRPTKNQYLGPRGRPGTAFPRRGEGGCKMHRWGIDEA